MTGAASSNPVAEDGLSRGAFDALCAAMGVTVPAKDGDYVYTMWLSQRPLLEALRQLSVASPSDLARGKGEG